MHYHLSIDKFAHIPPNTYKILIEELLKEIKHPFNEVNLLLSAWHESKIRSLESIIEDVKLRGFKSIELVLDHWQHPNHNMNYDVPTTFINFMAMASEKTYKIDTTSRIPSSKGLLFMGTKLERLNRVGLMKSLYDSKFLTPENILWTFDKRCLRTNMFKDKNTYKMYDDIDIAIEYFEQHSFKDETNNLGLSVLKNNNQVEAIGYHNRGSINHLYLETDYSIISETYYSENNPSVSEKTYNAILNRHPFIIVGCPKMLQYVKDFGFKTFDQYFTNNNYDDIEDDIARLKAITENIIEFPIILKRYKDDIEKDVEHNYILVNNIINEDRNILKNMYLKRQLPIDQIDNKFQIFIGLDFPTADSISEFINKYETISLNENFIQSYNNIKGSDWPNLKSREEFSSLPDWIQKECINIFNFNNINDS
jgi:hypothetical protein